MPAISVLIRKNKVIIKGKDCTLSKYVVNDVTLLFGHDAVNKKNNMQIITENNSIKKTLENNHTYNITIYFRLKSIKYIEYNDKGRMKTTEKFSYAKEINKQKLIFTVGAVVNNDSLTPYNYYLNYENSIYIFGCKISIRNDGLIVFKAKTSYGHSLIDILEPDTQYKVVIVKNKYLKLIANKTTYLSLKEF